MNFEALLPGIRLKKEMKPPEPEHDREILNRSTAPPADVNKGGMLQEESYDLLWHSIFEEGEDNAGSFNSSGAVAVFIMWETIISLW